MRTWTRWIVPLWIAGAATCLLAGVTMPLVTTKHLFARPQTYSVLEGIEELFATGQTGLGLLILLFSVVFPFGKLSALAALWFRRPDQELERWVVRSVKVLGKWSMLDFFVVLLLAGALDLGILSEARPESGTYVFATAVLLSMIGTSIVDRALGGPPRPLEIRPRMALALPFLAAAAGIVLARAIALPLMRVEKWYFWKKEYSLLSGSWQLVDEGHETLGWTLLALVVVVPFVSLAGWALLGVLGTLRFSLGRWARFFVELDEWAMTDVFLLALFVVLARVTELVSVQPLEGLQWLAGAAGALLIVSWWGRWAFR